MNASSDTTAPYFTVFQILWAIYWGLLHVKIRRGRNYAKGRELGSSDRKYKIISYYLYISGNLLPILTFWSNASWLLKFHDSDSLRLLGAMFVIAATTVYRWSLAHLGENYSPCYDSLVPKALIYGGPYSYERHPMYLAKVLIAVGTFMLCGSFWTLPSFLYLSWDMVRTVKVEEAYLREALADYHDYSNRVPTLFHLSVDSRKGGRE